MARIRVNARAPPSVLQPRRSRRINAPNQIKGPTSPASSENSETSDTSVNRRRRARVRALTKVVKEFSVTHPVWQRIPFLFQPSGQPYPVEEVAKRLVGHFLCCRKSNVVLRILETEAYEGGEDLYSWRFHEVAQSFRVRAGILVPFTNAFNQSGLVITTGDDASGDVVLLRSCEPIYGNEEVLSRLDLRTKPLSQYKRTNLISGFTNVFKSLRPDLRGNSDLLDASRGIHILQKGPVQQFILEGPRLVPTDTFHTKHSTMTGIDRNFRFALDDVPQTYKLKSTLRRTNP